MNEFLYTFVPIAVILLFLIALICMIYGLFSNIKKTSNTLENGEWKNVKIMEKKEIDFSGETNPYKYGYHFKVQLQDGTILEHNTITHDSYTNKLKEGQEIRVLAYKDGFMFEEDVKTQLKSKAYKEFAESHKSELERNK